MVSKKELAYDFEKIIADKIEEDGHLAETDPERVFELPDDNDIAALSDYATTMSMRSIFSKERISIKKMMNDFVMDLKANPVDGLHIGNDVNIEISEEDVDSVMYAMMEDMLDE